MEKPAEIEGKIKQDLAKALEATVFPHIFDPINSAESIADRLMMPLYLDQRKTGLGRGIILTSLTEGSGTHFVNQGAVPSVYVREQQFPVDAGHIYATIATVMPYQDSLDVYDFRVNSSTGKPILTRIFDLRQQQWFELSKNEGKEK